MTKPTGDAECPAYIDRTHYIDTLINEKAETRDLDDEELADEVLEISDDEHQDLTEVVPVKAKACQVKLEVQGPRLGLLVPLAHHIVQVLTFLQPLQVISLTTQGTGVGEEITSNEVGSS